MAFVTKARATLHKEALVLGLVGIMTGQTFSGSRRRVDNFGGLRKFIVALEAKLLPCHLQEHLVIGLMRIMTRRAFPGIRRRMFNFRAGQKIVVALEANVLHGTFQLLREL